VYPSNYQDNAGIRKFARQKSVTGSDMDTHFCKMSGDCQRALERTENQTKQRE